MEFSYEHELRRHAFCHGEKLQESEGIKVYIVNTDTGDTLYSNLDFDASPKKGSIEEAYFFSDSGKKIVVINPKNARDNNNVDEYLGYLKEKRGISDNAIIGIDAMANMDIGQKQSAVPKNIAEEISRFNTLTKMLILVARANRQALEKYISTAEFSIQRLAGEGTKAIFSRPYNEALDHALQGIEPFSDSTLYSDQERTHDICATLDYLREDGARPEFVAVLIKEAIGQLDSHLKEHFYQNPAHLKNHLKSLAELSSKLVNEQTDEAKKSHLEKILSEAFKPFTKEPSLQNEALPTGAGLSFMNKMLALPPYNGLNVQH